MTPEKQPWEPLYESDPIHLTIDKHKKNARITIEKRKMKRSKTMYVTPTHALANQLRAAIYLIKNKNLIDLLKDAAERLDDLDTIAEHYRHKAEEVLKNDQRKADK